MSEKTKPARRASGAEPGMRHHAVEKAPIAPGSSPSADRENLALPLERDEAPGVTNPDPSGVMLQAKRDIESGLVDTDLHATPGLDAARRKQLVPGPGGQAPADLGGAMQGSKRPPR